KHGHYFAKRNEKAEKNEEIKVLTSLFVPCAEPWKKGSSRQKNGAVGATPRSSTKLVQDGDELHLRVNRQVDRRFRLTTSNNLLQHKSVKTINTMVVDELNEVLVANIISYMCLRIARGRGRKTKNTKLMASASGST
ncbi:hypothetical protein H5410_040486, partial [Solanum commersonii]